ncbi:MAG: TRAFs-binding domain-containing protein [Verrucomicrobiota bacterium]
MPNPLCFVLMPFGKKPDAYGKPVDFDAVYRDLIGPSIRQAGLEPLRADEDLPEDIIHKPTFERLILCDVALADLTSADANVFYQIGVRHAVRPLGTVVVYAGNTWPQFDASLLRALPYGLDAVGKLNHLAADRDALTECLRAALQAGKTDSPLAQLVQGFQFPDIQRLKTDVFRERVAYSVNIKERLAKARQEGVEAVYEVETSLGNLADEEAGVLVDLFLSYRAVKAWTKMIALAQRMPVPLRDTVLVREQLALALNRNQEGTEAVRVLLDLIAARGPSSETYGILGRVYKDRWEAVLKNGPADLAPKLLNYAIEAYVHGFEADWRDAYPGINAVTLMELKEPPDPRRLQLIPIVSYAVERRIVAGKLDYWDYATRLELAVLAKEESRAAEALSDALASIREKWEPETTARNLRLIREARERRGESMPWAKKIEDELLAKAN